MPCKDPADRKAYNTKYRLGHKEEVKAWQQEHREELSAYYANYRQEHAEEKKAYEAKYYKEHREEEMARHAQRRQEHPAYFAQYRQTHKEEIKAWQQANLLKARESCAKRRALKKAATLGTVDLAAIIERDKGICGICCKRIRKGDKLHFDHIVPLSQGGAHAEWNIQAAHAFCNLSKHTGRLPSQTRLPI